MPIQLSDHFYYGKLLRFTLPTIIMTIFTSIYSVVDGFFISIFLYNYENKKSTPILTLIYLHPIR